VTRLPLTPTKITKTRNSTDIINAYIERGCMEYEIVDGWWLDAGENYESLLRANLVIARREGVNI
jgi:dTDP-glucose pyrophosphorylase